MSEIIEEHRNMFKKQKEVFGCKGLKFIIWKTIVMIGGGITNDGLSKSKVDPCGICSLRVKADSVLCIQCGRWIYGRCALV